MFNLLRQPQKKCSQFVERFRDLLDLQYDLILGASHSGLVTGDYHNQVDAFPQSEIGDFRTR
jgi:hypothetical protein